MIGGIGRVDNVILNEYANFNKNLSRTMSRVKWRWRCAHRISPFVPGSGRRLMPETANCLKLSQSYSAIRKTLGTIGYPSDGKLRAGLPSPE
jgi:hypothetical protein